MTDLVRPLRSTLGVTLSADLVHRHSRQGTDFHATSDEAIPE